MKRLIGTLAIALCAAAWLPAGAQAAHPSLGNFGIHGFNVTFTDKDGETETLAGGHPFAMTTTLFANADGEGHPEGWLKDFFAELPPGFLADATAYPQCTNADFIRIEGGDNSCQPDSQIGINAVSATEAGKWTTSPVYNLTPPPGVLLRLGFRIVSANITVDAGLSTEAPYNGAAASRNVSQLVEVLGNELQLWGNPSDPGDSGLLNRDRIITVLDSS
jgi:hypothetical protein